LFACSAAPARVGMVPVVTAGGPGVRGQIRTEAGWADVIVVPDCAGTPDEDGLIVLRTRATPLRTGGTRIVGGEG
jgi:hypothetical protein